MKKQISISTDGVCVYIISKVKTHKLGLAFLILFNIFVWAIILFVLSQPEEDSEVVKGKAILLLGGIPLYIFTVGRYTAWNLWGEERIIINTKSISYQYSYGLIAPNMTTKKFNKLSIGIRIVDNTASSEKGELILYDYNEDNLPIEIFTSTVLLKKTDLQLISDKTNFLFVNELYQSNKFIPFSIN